MELPENRAYDVVVAGGGPVGMMLACELALRGVSVLVAEQRAHGAPEPRRLTLHARTLELLDRRGLLAEFTAAEKDTADVDAYRRRLANSSARGHFAGLFLLGRGGATAEQPRELLLSRETATALLARRATAHGAVLADGTRVVGVEQPTERDGRAAAGVTVTLEDAKGTRTLRARWLVGCDGGRSTVRKLAGIGFPGTPPQTVSWIGLGTLTRQERLPTGWHRGERGWFMRMPDGRISTTEWDRPVPQEPPTAREVEESIHRVTGERVMFTEVRHLSRFTDSTRLAARYRAGHVLLAGDAAHVHFPAGGQGANLGLQDAVNLGWKLAAACRGRTGPLDTYEPERRPVAERVLHNTRAQVALMRPGPQVDALRDLFTRLMALDDVNDLLTRAIYGTDVDYGGDDAGGGGGPRVGAFVADRPLTTDLGPVRLAELHRDGRPLLLDFTTGSVARAPAAPWRDRVRVVAAPGTAAEAAVLLVRPDGHLAWAADAPVRPEDVRAALTEWAGPAADPV
ncbi:FAD-dependent monooxygenase [Streptomyces sp. NPDC086091]|uniref:FAD-dependent monooxygenase n=1 Tax=Streptomyces sp. NPDC086091 TaxID=3365751 RepID=UPI00380DBE72